MRSYDGNVAETVHSLLKASGINRYYNHERIKLGLQGLSPVEYRLRYAA